MAAPTLVGSAYTTAATSDTFNVTITNGFTAGNTVLIGLHQLGSIKRTIDSCGDGTNTYAELISTNLSFGYAHLLYKVNVSSVSAGATLTVALSGNAECRVTVQEISASTYATLSDSYSNASGATSHFCGATGLTTNGDVLVFGVASLTGGAAGLTPTDGYTAIHNSNDQTLTVYKSSAAGLSATQAPYTSTNARSSSGCMAAFYASGGAVGQPTIRRWGGVPHVGGRKSFGGGSGGGAWGRADCGLWVPNHHRKVA